MDGVRRAQLQENKEHRVGKVSFGAELGTVDQNQQKGHDQVDGDTGNQVQGGGVGQQAQQKAVENQPQKIGAGKLMLPADFKIGGKGGDDDRVPKAEEAYHGGKQQNKKENDRPHVQKVFPEGGGGFFQFFPADS